MSIVDSPVREVTGGVDTHLDVHVAAALDPIGGLLGVESFDTTGAGFEALLAWLTGFGEVNRVGWREPAPTALD
jgi:transposase